MIQGRCWTFITSLRHLSCQSHRLSEQVDLLDSCLSVCFALWHILLIKSRLFIFLSVNILLIMASDTVYTKACHISPRVFTFLSPITMIFLQSCPKKKRSKQGPPSERWSRVMATISETVSVDKNLHWRPGQSIGGVYNYWKGLSRFLKPQSEEGVLQQSHHQE